MRHDDDEGLMDMTLSMPKCSTFSNNFSDLKAFFSRCSKALLFLICDGPGSGDNGLVGDVLSGELQGVTVGEKLTPVGVFRQLGVTALMPRSLRTDARPKFTENVLQEFLRDKFRGVGGALKRNKLIFEII